MTPAILVVDDAPDWRAILAGVIRDTCPGMKVLTAESLSEAQQILEDEQLDLAVIDIRLDEGDEQNIDGLALMEHIRRLYKGVQIIIITGYASIDAVKKAMRADDSGIRPAMDFVEKDRVHLELVPRLKLLLTRSG